MSSLLNGGKHHNRQAAKLPAPSTTSLPSGSWSWTQPIPTPPATARGPGGDLLVHLWLVTFMPMPVTDGEEVGSSFFRLLFPPKSSCGASPRVLPDGDLGLLGCELLLHHVSWRAGPCRNPRVTAEGWGLLIMTVKGHGRYYLITLSCCFATGNDKYISCSPSSCR